MKIGARDQKALREGSRQLDGPNKSDDVANYTRGEK